jgi:hypothetical protein
LLHYRFCGLLSVRALRSQLSKRLSHPIHLRVLIAQLERRRRFPTTECCDVDVRLRPKSGREVMPETVPPEPRFRLQAGQPFGL